MKQLEFSSMEAREDFETIIQDALLYCQTTASVGRCVLKEIKARGRSTMGAKAFVHILLSTADALEDYAQRVAAGQGIVGCDDLAVERANKAMEKVIATGAFYRPEAGEDVA